MAETLSEPTKPMTGTRFNRLAIVSIVCAALALASLFVMGSVSFAIFAVGAGHVALHQIARRGERGELLALAGLVVAYGLGAWALVSTVQYWVVAIQQAI